MYLDSNQMPVISKRETDAKWLEINRNSNILCQGGLWSYYTAPRQLVVDEMKNGFEVIWY